jgi:hypothetical protein
MNAAVPRSFLQQCLSALLLGSCAQPQAADSQVYAVPACCPLQALMLMIKEQVSAAAQPDMCYCVLALV